MRYVPPHPLIETGWTEIAAGGRQVHWIFDANSVRRLPHGEAEQVGTWTIVGDDLTIRIPLPGGEVHFRATFTADMLAKGAILDLNGSMESKQLRFDGRGHRPDAGFGSHEWSFYLRRFAPDRNQADTAQRQILLVTSRMSSLFGTRVGMNRLQNIETYVAYADLIVETLCDGTLDKPTTDLVATTVAVLRRRFTEEDVSIRPDEDDVDRLADLAVDWCRLHPEPVPREPDPRMAF